MLEAVQQGDPQAAEELLPLVYEELRKLAAHKLAGEASGQTLQATALVYEAYLRLVGKDDLQWDARVALRSKTMSLRSPGQQLRGSNAVRRTSQTEEKGPSYE